MVEEDENKEEWVQLPKGKYKGEIENGEPQGVGTIIFKRGPR
jgi:hypothetical protein